MNARNKTRSWFSIMDVVAALTDSPTPRQYWGNMKQLEFIALQLSPNWVQLKLKSSDGARDGEPLSYFHSNSFLTGSTS